MRRKIIILGSTGSIGTQALDVIRAHREEFEILGLSAHENGTLFEMQVQEFQPKYGLQTAISENPSQALMELAAAPDADLVVIAISGSAGLMPTYAAIRAGKKIALANKESLVMAGELLVSLAAKTGAEIFPIDSEPSAIWQIIDGRNKQEIEKLIITASGGPFWKWTWPELEKVSIEQALKHPTWKMGEKVSIDSATLMNKAFEIIEVHFLFGIPKEKIEVSVHRQSIVHGMVQWCDGNVSAILSPPDMHFPISYALFYPERKPFFDTRDAQAARLDFTKLQLAFEAPDFSLFEGPRLAHDVLSAGGIMPAALCLADEIAVRKFLNGEISFLGIYDFIKKSLDRVKNIPLSMEALAELQERISPKL